MDQSELVDALLPALDRPLSLDELMRMLPSTVSGPLPVHQLAGLLRGDWRVAELAHGVFRRAAGLFAGVTCLLIPDQGEPAAGLVSLPSAEHRALFGGAIARGEAFLACGRTRMTARLEYDEEEAAPRLAGLADWFRKVHFEAGRDAILCRVTDYEGGRFSLEIVPTGRIDELVKSDTCRRLLVTIEQALRERAWLGENGDELVPVRRILWRVLDTAGLDWRAFPCNLSFWMELDRRFHVRGDWVDLADRLGINPFASHYVDPSLEIRMEDPDLDRLEQALAQLFEKGEARPARQQLLELRLRYPGEMLLYKFLYQAAYFLEEENAVLSETEAYSRAFPGDPDPWRTRAEVFFHQGDFESALEAVRRAEELAHPDDWGFLGDLYVLWMFLCWESGDRDGAWSMACRIRARDPENAELARFLEETGLAAAPPPDGEVIRYDFRRRVRLEKNGERKT